jgi:DALR anticodon binding domain
VNKPPFEILLPAIRILLANKIQKAAFEVWKIIANEGFAPDRTQLQRLRFTNHAEGGIPLQRVKTITRVWYVSAIAFQAAGGQRQVPLKLAQAITSVLLESENDEQGTDFDQGDQDIATANTSRSILTSQFFIEIWINSTIWVTFPGWIYWQISNAGLAAWLQTILHTDLSLPAAAHQTKPNATAQQQIVTNADLPFSIFQTHARCCSLLRSAHRQGWIELSETAPALTILTPLSWQTHSDRFILDHPAEWELAMALVDAIDEISLKATQMASMRRQAQRVSDAFESFQAQCPLIGANRDVRLGLVAATQRILRLVLEDGLKVDAPRAL